jgi:sec-independent protein translocase protein TatA
MTTPQQAAGNETPSDSKSRKEPLFKGVYAMFGLGTQELIVIGIIVFLLFGAKRIPEIGKGLGGAIREFRDARKEISNDVPKEGKKEEPKQQASMESKLAEKVAEQIPGVKQVMNAKDKVDKVRQLMKS